MSVLNIREAKREGARIVIGLAGVSGSGKTYTALQIAYGLANGNAKKVGFLDTENRRGSLYADSLPEPFLIGDLYAPFSPQRYIDAIKEFQDAGVEVLVIDSVSHEYEGTGGLDEIAHATRFPDWKRAKAEHKRFMNVLLQSDMHVICCIRAREKIDFSDTKNPRPLGVQPIQEKNFMFEMTISLMMLESGMRREILKCPNELLTIMGNPDGYITSENGMLLRGWIDGAATLDPQVEHYRNRLQTITEQGLDTLGKSWAKTPAAIRKVLGDNFKNALKASAAAYDEQRKNVSNDTPDVIGELNNVIANAIKPQVLQSEDVF